FSANIFDHHIEGLTISTPPLGCIIDTLEHLSPIIQTTDNLDLALYLPPDLEILLNYPLPIQHTPSSN
ncbi:11468_t:CDS:2, partial [Gigaspora margarita]